MKFAKETAKFCASLERHLNLSTKKSENSLQEVSGVAMPVAFVL